jgi:succinate dehydrogenase / fumarate reductase iron-sulfur subunit
MTEDDRSDARHDAREGPDERTSRRELLARVAMGGGVVAAYGVLAVEGLLFLVPRRTAPPTRLIFIGRLDDFPPGEVKTVHDLEGRAILIRRTQEGLVAFSSVCPHLGCQVHWEPDENRFFCPCHRGEFDEQGVAYGGPPGDAGQKLADVPLQVEGGVVYLEVPATEKKGGRA